LGWGVADIIETCSCPKCVTIPNFMALGQTVWRYVGGSKNLGTLRPCPIGTGGVADPLETRHSPTCTIPNSCWRPNRLGRYVPKFFWRCSALPFKLGACLTDTNMLFPHLCYRAKFGHLSETVQA